MSNWKDLIEEGRKKPIMLSEVPDYVLKVLEICEKACKAVQLIEHMPVDYDSNLLCVLCGYKEADGHDKDCEIGHAIETMRGDDI